MKSALLITHCFRPNVGGAETYADELCSALAGKGFYVYVLAYQPLSTPGARGLRVEKLQNLEIRRFRWIGGDLFHKLLGNPILCFLYITPYLFARCLLWMLKNHEKVGMIDAHGLNAAFIARGLKRIFKKRAGVNVVSLYDFRQGSLFARIVRWTLSGMDLIVVEKGKSKKELMDIGIEDGKYVEYVQWADHDLFKPADKREAKRALGWEGKFIVLFVGRALPEKGAEIILDASKNVSGDVTFAFVTGSGPASHRIMKEAEKNPRIVFIGEVDYYRLPVYYQAADVFCLPSRYEEGISRALIEAISCGTPAIVTNRGSIPYVVNEDVAISIPPTPEEFAGKISYLHGNPDKLKAMTENCRPYAERHLGRENMRVIVDAYTRLVDQ